MKNAGGKGLSQFAGREDIWAGTRWGLLKSGKPGPWVWEGCTFAPVPNFLGGCKFLPHCEGGLHLFVLGCSLWYFRDIGPPCWDHYFRSMNCLTSLSPIDSFCDTLHCRPFWKPTAWESHPHYYSPGIWESSLCGLDWLSQGFLPKWNL